MKLCPFCAEEIQDAAIVCKHCRRDLPAPDGPPTPPAESDQLSMQTPERRERPKSAVRSIGMALTAIGFVMTLAPLTAALGILVMWFGLGLAITGSGIVRWGGGFLLALGLGAVGMAIGGAAPSSSGAGTPGAYRQTCVTADGQDCTPGAVPSRPPAASTATPTSSSPPSSSSTTPPSSTPSLSYDLALVSANGYESEYGGYHYVEGRVKNVSDRPLQHVTAVASWFDKEGEFIKSDDALIDYDPILPGQTSPFKTITTGNPAMSKYTVEFKTLFGGTLLVDDQRKKKRKN